MVTTEIPINGIDIIAAPDENKESIALLWFDPNIGSRSDTEKTKEQLRHINDYVKFYSDLETCITYIQSITNEKIFLITSGSKASQILPLISSLPQIDSIFIFCIRIEKYQYLTNEYSKIIGIYNHLDALCSSIREQVDLVDKQLQAFSYFDQHQKSTKDLSKQSGEFLWFQMFNHVILRLPRDQQAKQQMIDICRQYYRGNTKEQQLIDEFEHEYRPEEAIRWYSRQSFVYKLVNKALRSEDIDQLHTFRFFIGDLSGSLAREHEKILSSNEDILTLYRGVKLDKEEFDKLKENKSQLISTNGYLSTSRLRAPALEFVMKPTKRTDVVPVLFEIKCNVKELDKSIVFADIAEFSEYSYEQEVLFDLSAAFRIESIEEDEEVQLIKMNATKDGETITKDYISLTHHKTEGKSIVLVFGKLMCDLGQYDKSQKYFEQLLKEPNGEDLAWIEYNIGRALYLKGDWKNAGKYYHNAYNRMMNATPARIEDSAHVFHSIGKILYRHGKYDQALEYYQQALKIHENYYPNDHVGNAAYLHSIGRILHVQKKHDEALANYQRALEIQEEFYPSGHFHIASTLNNIGLVLNDQGKYDEALICYQRTLEMQEKYYPSGHIAIVASLNNIGCILNDQKKYDKALDYYQRALKVQEKYYPSGHVDITDSLNNIGNILHRQQKNNEALECHKRALRIREEYYTSGHIDIAISLSNIGNILHWERKYDEALDCYKQALKMREKCHASDQFGIPSNLNSIGHVLYDQKKYSEALEYYQQGLTILEKHYPSGHIDIAQSFSNIGRALKRQGKSDEALDSYKQAIKIQENYYPSGHVDIADNLDKIGLILFNQEKFDEAISYQQEALKIREKYYPSGHIDIGHGLNNMGIYYEKKKDSKTALDYFQQALAIYKKLLPVGDPDRTMVENNIRRVNVN